MVSFPGLGLYFEVNPIAINIFGIDIYWYAVCIVIAITTALILCAKNKNNYGIDFDFAFECFIFAIIFGIIGARIYYVIFKLDYYISNPIKILDIRDGGLAIYGGLIAGFIVMFKRCKKYNRDIINLLDYIVPFISLGQAIGRWGNYFNIEAYGTETSNVFRMGIITQTGYSEVHPTFLYESFLDFCIFIILKIMQKNRKFKGEITTMYLFLYSGIRMIIEGIRVDSLMIENIRISQILSIAIFVISGIMLLKNNIKKIYSNFKSGKC